MIKYIFLITIIFLSFFGSAQKYDNNWILGGGVIGKGHNVINFSKTPPLITRNEKNIKFTGIILSISDIDGHFIFYSNGLDIRNKDDEILKNSEGFNYSDSPYFRRYMALKYQSDNGRNAMITIPQPKDTSKYIIFHQSIGIDSQSISSLWVLHFTIIDMDKDNGLGEVIKKNILIRRNIDGVSVTKHANGKDWWLVTSDYFTNEYLVYLIDSSGISKPQSFKIGPIPNYKLINKNLYHASLKFTPNGKILIRNKFGIGMFVSGFNRRNGKLDYKYFNKEYANSHITFSPNSKYAYFKKSVDYRLIQYDIEKNKIFPTSFFITRNFLLAPDDKVYFSGGPIITGPDKLNYLSYINRPNLPGDACDPHYNAFKLPKRYSFGMPQYPNYRLGKIENYIEKKDTLVEYIFRFDQNQEEINTEYTKRDINKKESKLLKKLFGTKNNLEPILKASSELFKTNSIPSFFNK